MIAVGIAHAGWMEGRKETLTRLTSQLKDQGLEPVVFTSTRREHAGIWALRLWRWAARQSVPIVLLNDDVTVAPRFAEAVEHVVACSAEPVLSLHCSHPVAPSLFAAGEHWLRCYWASGPGYCFPSCYEAAAAVDYWEQLPVAMRAKWNEDEVLSRWLFSLGAPAMHTLPALVKHDVATASSMGYDGHPNRQALVTWENVEADLSKEDFWLVEHEPLLVPNPWLSDRDMAMQEPMASSGPTSARCWFCLTRTAGCASAVSGAAICGKCIGDLSQYLCHRTVMQ